MSEIREREVKSVSGIPFLMIRRPPRSTQSRSSAASDVYKRQVEDYATADGRFKLTRHYSSRPYGEYAFKVDVRRAA